MSDKITHTPGPWRWLNGNTLMGDHGNRPIILSAACLHERKASDGRMGPLDPTGPNANLIALAPTMFSLLQELIDIEGPQPGTAQWADKVRTVIAEASP